MKASESIQILERLDLSPDGESRDIVAEEKEFNHLIETGQVDQLMANPLFQNMDGIGKLDIFNQCVDNRLKQFDRIARVVDRVNNREVFLMVNQAAVKLNRLREKFTKEYLEQQLNTPTFLPDSEKEAA